MQLKPSDWYHPCCSGLQVQGTAISPAAWSKLLYRESAVLSSFTSDFTPSATKLYHAVDTSSCSFEHVLRKVDLFAASSFQAVIDIHKCCDLHVHAGERNCQRIEFFIRTGKLKVFYNAVLCSDDKFFFIGFLCKIHDPVVDPT